MIAKPTILGIKRQSEPTTPTPDPKRLRQDPATKPASDRPPSDLPPSSESATPTANPATLPNPHAFATMPLSKRQEFMEKYHRLCFDLKQEYAAYRKAQVDGTSPEVILTMKADVTKKLEFYKLLSAYVPKDLLPSTGAAPAPSSQPPFPSVSAPSTTPATGSSLLNLVPPALEPTQPPPPPTAATEPQNLNPTIPTKESHPTEVVAQTHRPMQQQNHQQLPQQSNLFYSFHLFPAYLLAGTTTQLPVVNNPSTIPTPGLQKQWHGMFSSIPPNGSSETIIHVSIDFPQNAEP